MLNRTGDQFKIYQHKFQASPGRAHSCRWGQGYLEVNRVRAKGMRLWEYNLPKVVKIKCVNDSGLLSVYNIFEDDDGSAMSQMYKCGMLLEEQGNKRIYRCSEYSDEGDFDRLVFQIELL